ncbi:MAG: hypothetical protein II240_04440 [Bacteroidaceae bacterium]|nr:hypothetical protein [Bacteroidaceae bacterium]
MDYAPIEAFLVGRCGRSVKAAALTSVEEYNLLAEGHSKAEQEEWERLRWRVFMEWTISPNLKRRPRSPHDIVRFPWEQTRTAEVQNAEPLTENEIAALCNIFKIERKKVTNG